MNYQEIVLTEIHLYFESLRTEAKNTNLTDELRPNALQTYLSECSSRKLELTKTEVEIIYLLCTIELNNSFFYKLTQQDVKNSPAIGGILDHEARTFTPTLQTLLYFTPLHKNPEFGMQTFLQMQHLNLLQTTENPSLALASKVSLSKELNFYLIKGVQEFRTEMLPNLPLEKLDSNMTWEDLVLSFETLEDLEEIHHWLAFQKELQSFPAYNKRVKKGYRALFYGPPGTGKTITATLLGKRLNLPVFRIDLSKIVSKYIGETEKKLAEVFNVAESRNWVLFFDEADALLGKRSSQGDGKDKYANQEVSYILQRIENYDGLILLATNLKNNLDEAFFRRFQSVIHFKKPTSQMRKTLWEKNFNGGMALSSTVNWDQISRQYDLTGGNIVNILQSSYIHCLGEQSDSIQLHHLERGIRKELVKSGRK